jgi:signal peptidase I
MSTTVDPPIDARQDAERRHRGGGRRLVAILLVAGCAVLLALLLRTYVVQTFYVPSGSMLPTLQIGDKMLVDKLPWVVDDIHRGDIIVFHKTPADNSPGITDLVKRVVGLPGETISSRGDTVLIDGRAIAEPWLPKLVGQCAQAAFDIPRTVIAPRHYFVMGDCRGNSYDSRYWGTVPQSYVVGKVFLVVWQHGHPWLHWF